MEQPANNNIAAVGGDASLDGYKTVNMAADPPECACGAGWHQTLDHS